MSFVSRVTSLFASTKLSAQSSSAPGKGPLRTRVFNREFRIEISMKIWREAVNWAKAPMLPRRELLYEMYDTAMEDEHLMAQVRTARFTIQLAPYKILRKGKEEEDLKIQLFDTPWFYNYLQFAVDSEIYGHSLVEVVEKDANGHLSQIWVMYRTHVRPQTGEVVLDVGDSKGLLYGELPLARQMIEIGDPDDLGLLMILSKLVIRKDLNIVDWGRRNERFGMPFIMVKTSSRDAKEIDAKENMLKNFGSNGWGIFDDMDSLDLKEPISNTGGGHKTYLDFANRMDDKISQLVNGQTGTTDEQAYVGSAEVHERILNKYVKARMRRIQNHINFQLYPWLIKYHGYPLEDCQMIFTDLEERPEMTTDGPNAPKPGENPLKPGETAPPEKKKAVTN